MEKAGDSTFTFLCVLRSCFKSTAVITINGRITRPAWQTTPPSKPRKNTSQSYIIKFKACCSYSTQVLPHDRSPYHLSINSPVSRVYENLTKCKSWEYICQSAQTFVIQYAIAVVVVPNWVKPFLFPVVTKMNAVQQLQKCPPGMCIV